MADEALTLHSTTGRLWSLLLFLSHILPETERYALCVRALHQVPKSGEVWCECARIHMTPGQHYNLKKARTALEFALQFTPQYGDTYIEYSRLLMLEKGYSIIDDVITRPRERVGPLPEPNLFALLEFVSHAQPNYGIAWSLCRSHPHERECVTLRRAYDIVWQSITRNRASYTANICHNKTSLCCAIDDLYRIYTTSQHQDSDTRARIVLGYNAVPDIPS